MSSPPLEPSVSHIASSNPLPTGYDHEHLITYLRLLDAETDGADWQEVAKIVLRIDPGSEPRRARLAWESHLARARWMTQIGYKHLLMGGPPH